MPNKEDIVFSRNAVEFVTVAAEYCVYVEHANENSRKDFVDTILKLLPLLYLKAQMLPEKEEYKGEESLESFVSQEDYEIIRMNLAELFADKDDYLDVFLSDMKYSDTPILKTISEDLTDIYQDIKNFVILFRSGINETMHDALVQCQENFISYWGQTLVNTLRAIHEVKFKMTDDESHDEEYN